MPAARLGEPVGQHLWPPVLLDDASPRGVEWLVAHLPKWVQLQFDHMQHMLTILDPGLDSDGTVPDGPAWYAALDDEGVLG
jgi:hypothetical protein